MDKQDVSVAAATAGSGGSAAEEPRLRRAGGGWFPTMKGIRLMISWSWMFLSMNRVWFPAALYEGYEAPVKLFEIQNEPQTLERLNWNIYLTHTFLLHIN